ncbi:MAG: inositol monophosphatase family protein [Candidatus Saccharibacteria bacterium]
MLSESDFLKLAHSIAGEIRNYIRNYHRHQYESQSWPHLNSGENASYTPNPTDCLAYQAILDIVNRKFPYMLEEANFLIEGFEPVLGRDAQYTLFIDPVDGSRSAALRIGDPCIMLAFSPKRDLAQIEFRDLHYSYVEGLHTGDTYFTYCGKCYYVPGGFYYEAHDEDVYLYGEILLEPIHLKQEYPRSIEEASVIVRDGHGMRRHVREKINHSILDHARHVFSYDITGLELSYLASGRDIVHLLVESRSHFDKGRLVGSDGFNLLPFPLVKAAGGVVYSLDGEPLDEQLFNPYGVYDFVAASNPKIFKEFVARGGIRIKNPLPWGEPA